MALISKVTWIHPQNWNGNVPDTGPGWKKVILLLTGHCDSDGLNVDETDVVKLNISELLNVNREVPVRTSIERIRWSVNGFYNVKLSWDRAPENTIAVLAGEGKIRKAILDPGEDGDRTGDIMLSTLNAELGASYSIELHVRLK